jgi:hypothetical protein
MRKPEFVYVTSMLLESGTALAIPPATLAIEGAE